MFGITRKHLKKSDIVDSKTNCIKIFPTFGEFVQYIIADHSPNSKNMDPHWMTFNQVKKKLYFVTKIVLTYCENKLF